MVHNRTGQSHCSCRRLVLNLVAFLGHAQCRNPAAVLENNGVALRHTCKRECQRQQKCHPHFLACGHLLNLLHGNGCLQATLPPYALSEYTASMWIRAIALAAFLVVSRAPLTAQQTPLREPREILSALNRLQLDPAATYKIEASQRIEIRRGDSKLLFEDGYLTFFAANDGEVTGAVFSGHGHILAAPRDPVEKQQLAHFLGASVIDQNFATAYIRFTDDTATELLEVFRRLQVAPQLNSAFADAWQSAVLARNPAHSFR